MARLLARLLALLVAHAALASCTRTHDGGTSATSGAGPSLVRFSIASDPRTLDPLFAGLDSGGAEVQLARLAFEPFVDIDAHGRPVPALLERIPTLANGGISADGTVLTYVLRRNVRWHDGVPVTARDVLFTLHAILDRRNPVRARETYARIVVARALDAHTVRFRLNRAWAPGALTFFSYGSPAAQYVLPAHLLARERDLATSSFAANPVGDGPYRFVSWHRGDDLAYEANAAYWRGAPAVARLDVRIVADPGTNLTLLRGGDLTWNLIAPSQRAVLADRRDLRFTRVPVSLAVGLALNTRNAPFDDANVRRALAASIDRDAISRKITLGLYPPVDTAQPIGSWARDPAVRLPRYDPARADALLDAAGWRRGADGIRARAGKPLALTYAQFPESSTGVRVANFVQAELKERGIAVTVKSVQLAQLYLPAADGGVLASGRYDLAYVMWPMGDDPDDSALLTCGAPANYMGYCDPAVDADERAALAATEPGARRAIYARIERRVAADVPVIWLFTPGYTYASHVALAGFAPNAFLPTWNAAAWSMRRSP
jgi:peptide/nickel transport system substrate-binding protein